MILSNSFLLSEQSLSTVLRFTTTFSTVMPLNLEKQGGSKKDEPLALSWWRRRLPPLIPNLYRLARNSQPSARRRRLRSSPCPLRLKLSLRLRPQPKRSRSQPVLAPRYSSNSGGLTPLRACSHA